MDTPCSSRWKPAAQPRASPSREPARVCAICGMGNLSPTRVMRPSGGGASPGRLRRIGSPVISQRGAQTALAVGQAVRDGGRLEPVRRAELAQDVRDVDAGRLDADDERRAAISRLVQPRATRSGPRPRGRSGREPAPARLASGGPASGGRGRAARAGRAAPAPAAAVSLRSEPRRCAPGAAARSPRCGTRRRRRAPRPRASGSRPRAAGVRAGPRPRRRPTTARAAPRRARARTRPRPARASRGVGCDRRGLRGGPAGTVMSCRARRASPAASASRRARASAASSAWARSPFAQNQTRSCAAWRRARHRQSVRTASSASVQRRSHSASSAR